MCSKTLSGFSCALTALALTISCKRGSDTPAGYFKTQFQTESEYIVGAIVTDLAEQVYFAENHKLPEKKYFSVTATEAGGSLDEPLFDVKVSLDKLHKDLDLKLDVNGPIWSPAVYHDLLATLANIAGLNSSATAPVDDTDILSDLLDAKPETIEQDNESLSYKLENDFKNPELHEQAALLLGAFLLRDHSGNFFDIRSPLCRITAHLAMARFLSGADAFGVNGQLAEAMMLTLVNDEAPALEELKSLDTHDSSVAAMVRALQARDTGDFRPLNDPARRTPVESIIWFTAMADYADTPSAWLKLDDDQKQTVDFVRAAFDESYSVEMGHELLQAAIPLELHEIDSIYQLSRGKQLGSNELVAALNELPDRCFYLGSAKDAHVHVIGWGQWAAFLQRQLCHVVQKGFYFLQYNYGDPDAAKEYSAQYDQQFGGLRLYPFVRRFNCTDVDSYHQSVDDGFKVTVATPHLVPAECWNYLCYDVSFAPSYDPVPDPHVNEWHNHNPPPGTVYDLHPRLNHPSLVDRDDANKHFEQLHELAPYDVRISNFLIKNEYKDNPTPDQVMSFYHDMVPYSVVAAQAVANSVKDQPDQYEQFMLQAAALNPSYYYTLGDYFIDHRQVDKGAQYVDKACDLDPDSVRVSDHAVWRVHYYLKKGDTNKARQIADFGAQVYSYVGLEAEADFMEMTSNYDDAFSWYAKIEDRYNDSAPVMNFCLRYKALTGDPKYDAEVQKRIKILFPKGIEKVSLDDFHSAPSDGVLIQDQNDLILSAGLKQGDVIVAIGGTAVHSFNQYSYVRETQDSPGLDLIVWQGNAYNEIKASPPIGASV